MKRRLVISIFLLLFAFGIAKAESNPQAKENRAVKQNSCAFKYVTCMDQCHYYQDQGKISGCQSRCKSSYKCRPKPIKLPKGASVEEG